MWELDYKEGWVPKNWCFWTVVLEKTLESALDYKEIQPVHPKGDQSWVFISRTDVDAETSALWPPHLKRPWCWERLKAGGEGDDREWDGWMASPTRWTWVWVSSRSWWWTGKPGVLHSMGSQRVRHDGVTELNWTWIKNYCYKKWVGFLSWKLLPGTQFCGNLLQTTPAGILVSTPWPQPNFCYHPLYPQIHFLFKHNYLLSPNYILG